MEQPCRVCSKSFETNNPAHIRCSKVCRDKEREERNKVRLLRDCIPEPNSGCWLWLERVKIRGLPYGEFKMNGKTRVAHQAAFEIFKGPRDRSLHVLHSCDNPYCVNPDHLSQGTAKENQQQKVDRGRSMFGEKSHQAKLKEADVLAIRRGYAGQRGYLERMAEKYSMDPSTMGDIIKRKRWKHLP